MSKKSLRTGQVANQAGVSIATLRYYERRGLIRPPQRTPSGYRAFDPQTVTTVRLIKKAQQLGFTLKEIHRLLDLVFGVGGTCSELHDIARAKLDDLQSQLSTLQMRRDLLTELLQRCEPDPNRAARDCSLLCSLVADDDDDDSGRHDAAG
jgi:MerR family transcriptional regulator, mercuric resistance operon regulatory protein